MTQDALFERVCAQLCNEGYVDDGYLASVRQRATARLAESASFAAFRDTALVCLAEP